MISTAARMRPFVDDGVVAWPHWQLLQGVLEGTADFIVALDPAYRFLIANTAFRKEFQDIYGLKPETGTSITEILAHLPAERYRVMHFVKRVLRGDILHGTLRFGDVRYARHVYDLNMFPIVDDADDIIAAGLIGRNISVAHRNEVALRDLNERLEQRVYERSVALEASEASLRIATECARVGIWCIDLATGRQEWSAMCAELFGIANAPPGIDSTILLERVAAPDRAIAEKVVRGAIGSGCQFKVEFRVRCDDGTLRWLQARGQVETQDGQPARLAGVLLDIHDHKQLTEALSESERNWRELAEVMPQVVWSATPDGAIRYVNQRWYAMTGLAAGCEALWPDVLHPDDRERTLKGWTHALTTGEPYQIEYRFKASSPHIGYRWFLARALPIRDTSGVISCWYGTCTDIHEQKIGQEALARANDRWQEALAQLDSLLENAPLGFAFFDRDCRYMRVNAHLARMNGLPPEAHIGHTVRDVIPNITSLVESLIHEVFRTGRTLHHEISGEVPTEPGVVRTWDCIFYPVRTRHGDSSWVGVVATDITTRKQVEQALAASEARFRGVFENAAVGLAQVGLDGRWRRVNRRLCEILGYTQEELHARTFIDVTHPEDLQIDLDLYAQLKAGTIPSYQREKRYIRKDGTPIWVNLTGSLQRDDSGRIGYAIAVVEDITARKQAEEALLDADRRKDDFLAMLAHELRNPMAAVSNAITLLKLPSTPAALQRQNLSIMERQMRQLVRLVDDLLDISRITRGKVELRRELIDLRMVLQCAIESCRGQMIAAGHQLKVALPEIPLWMDGDSERLIQVFVNLLTNAIRYTDPGGHITITASLHKDAIQVRVADTGIGIPPPLLPKIFDIFTQGGTSSGCTQGGLGLGLTLVRTLVEMHGGTVTAFSEGAGQGSVFTILLPMVAQPANYDAGTASTTTDHHEDAMIEHAQTREHRHRVLVVDDNDASAKTLGWMFEALGAEVQVAHSGEEAVSIALAFLPNLILMDIGMPIMDGYEACRLLRQQETLAQTVIVAQTGWGQPEDRRRAREAGFDQHLVKPVMIEHLQGLLEDLDVREVAP